MIGIYFSGTGNSKYALEIFLRGYNDSVMFSIEDENLIEQISYHDEIVFSYPVQYSTVPKIMSDFVHSNSGLWKEKNVFIIATMALFSGDGAGVLGRLLEQYGAQITGGLHLQMPDSIADEKVLKRSLQKNNQLVKNANSKIAEAIAHIKNGKYPQEFYQRIIDRKLCLDQGEAFLFYIWRGCHLRTRLQESVKNSY